MTTDLLAALPWKSKGVAPVIAKGERLLLDAKHHWMKYVSPTLLYALLCAVCFILFSVAGSLGSSSPRWAMGLFFSTLIALFFVEHWFFHFVLSESVTDMMLTNTRILLLDHRLWLSDTMDEIILTRIRMVEVNKRGILQRIFNYGDLWFDTGGGKTVSYVPAPQTWSRQIERMMMG